MSLAILHTRAQAGIEALPVNVEVHLAGGLPSTTVVGLADTEVKESRERVRAALINSHFDYPARRITVNLAPADLPKGGGRFDLAIALGILAASGQIPSERLGEFEFLGELALSGELRGVHGILPCAIQARAQGRTLILPTTNVPEASLVDGVKLLHCRHLLDLCAHLTGQTPLTATTVETQAASNTDYADLADVRGQQHAKRALTIAAAGGHSLLLIGPPGTGKTMLATRLPGILPPMTETEALETAAIQSISHHGFDPGNWRRRPYRAPHHTASAVALVGGGCHFLKKLRQIRNNCDKLLSLYIINNIVHYLTKRIFFLVRQCPFLSTTKSCQAQKQSELQIHSEIIIRNGLLGGIAESIKIKGAFLSQMYSLPLEKLME